MPRIRSLSLAALAAAAAITLSACATDVGGYVPADPYGTQSAPGTGGGAYGSGGPTPTDPAPADETPAADAPAANEPALIAKEVGNLGTVVTDAAGFTLYRFDDDTADPPNSTCVEACAKKWPPYVVDPDGTLTLDGVEQSAISKLRRPDGDIQLTIEGWPVYRFAADPDAGSTEGQGVGGTWFAVTPEGKKAAPAP